MATISEHYESEVQEIAKNKASTLIITSRLTGKKIHFPAFLTPFGQSFASTWNEEEVYGRMDPIATFQGTRRTIAVSFTLPSPNAGVAKDNLNNCRLLAQFLYPGYSVSKNIGTALDTAYGANNDKYKNEAVIARPPLVSIKYANLIDSDGQHGLLGYLSGLEWTPSLDMGMFQAGGELFPKVIELSFTFNVLHQKSNGFDSTNQWTGEKFF